MSIEEKVVTNTDFPSMTLCNLNPLANTNLNAGLLQEALDMYRQYITMPHSSGELDKYMLAAGQQIQRQYMWTSSITEDWNRMHGILL